MLIGLHIENVAAIETLDVEFEGGYNVLSGETGAGKSIIIDSINMVTGARTSKDIIRNGCSSAKVQALFSCNGEEALLSRELFSDGRSVCRVNGALSTAAAVRELAPQYLTIHGQHDNQLLLQSGNHLMLLDRYSKTEELLLQYKAAFEDMNATKSKFEDMTASEGELSRRLDILKFQIDEIDKAELVAGEFEELTDERMRLSNAEKIAEAVNSCHEMLYGTGGVHDILSSSVSSLERAVAFDDRLSGLVEALNNAGYEIDDVSHELGRYASSVESDPNRLEMIEERLDLISTLKKKYGSTIEEILEYREKIGEEADEIEFSGETIEKLKAKIVEQTAKAKSLADSLSEKRSAKAKKMCREIMDELAFLDMKSIKFDVGFTETDFTQHGCETAEFLIATNPGEELKPLVKIASGGELSRIMLAIQTVLTDDVETLIFDEIDSGVSGRAALKIAQKLYGISRGRQVICITHLAQIAAMADCHFLIEKMTDKSSARTTVAKLDGDKRLSELARITGGVTITDLTLKNAAEMLAQAQEVKYETNRNCN